MPRSRVRSPDAAPKSARKTINGGTPGGVAKRLRHLVHTEEIVGSNPTAATNTYNQKEVDKMTDYCLVCNKKLQKRA